MSQASDAADQVVRESIQITESSLRLLAGGSEKILQLLIALSKDKTSKGYKSVERLARDRRPICVFQMHEDDIRRFNELAKSFNIAFAVAKEKEPRDHGGFCEVLAKVDDMHLVNRIMERMGLPAPFKDGKDAAEKNDLSRDPSSRKSNERGDGLSNSVYEAVEQAKVTVPAPDLSRKTIPMQEID